MSVVVGDRVKVERITNVVAARFMSGQGQSLYAVIGPKGGGFSQLVRRLRSMRKPIDSVKCRVLVGPLPANIEECQWFDGTLKKVDGTLNGRTQYTLAGNLLVSNTYAQREPGWVAFTGKYRLWSEYNGIGVLKKEYIH